MHAISINTIRIMFISMLNIFLTDISYLSNFISLFQECFETPASVHIYVSVPAYERL